MPERPERVVVMGRGGKTSLATAIGERYDHDFLELDSVVWLPNWQLRDHRERTEIIERWIDSHPDGWVIDGDTADTAGEELTSRADTVIWVDLPFRTVFLRVVRRTIKRIRNRTRVCGENYETWRHSFLARDALIYLHIAWLVNGRWRRHKKRLEKLLNGLREDQTGIRIRSADDLDRFYAANDLSLPHN